MDRRERYEDPTEAQTVIADGIRASIYTALPGQVISFNPANQTVDVQPTIQGRFLTPAGEWVWVTMPVFPGVPVMFPNGGGFVLTFPIEQGDECLLIVASRCIDAWWQFSGVQVQAEVRFQDLSDCFALVGPRSLPRAIPNLSINSVQLRTMTGDTYVDVNETAVTIKAPTEVVIDAPLTTVKGMLVVEELLTYQAGIAGTGGSHGSIISGDLVQTGGELSSDGVVLATHIHSGVDPGGGNSGPPV